MSERVGLEGVGDAFAAMRAGRGGRTLVVF